MRSVKFIAALAALSIALSLGCSKQRANSPSVKNSVKDSLKQAGFDKISVDEDRGKGVVTLTGNVVTQEEKAKAEAAAQQAAGNEIIANEILVTGGDKGQARRVSGDIDKAIEARVKEFIDAEKLNKQHIRYEARRGVLTLTGSVDSAELRTAMDKKFATIDGVTQVVDKLEVKNNRRQTAHNRTM